MFDNSRFGFKFAAALAVVAGMGILSARLGDSIQPSLWRCVAQPARWDGTALWLPKARVVASDVHGFEIEVQGARARAVPAAGVGPGDTVAVTGTFRAEGPVIQVKRVHKAADSAGPRRLSEAVSIAVLALVLLNFLRHFALRPKAFQVGGTD